MKTKTTRVTGTDGVRFRLHTDDTLTLAFPGWVESTPETLRKYVSKRSLKRIAAFSRDGNEQEKATRALAGFSV